MKGDWRKWIDGPSVFVGVGSSVETLIILTDLTIQNLE